MISPPTLRRAAICEVLISLSQLSACSNARGFDLSAGVTQGADSRGLYLSPTRGTIKTRSKPRKWGDAGRSRRQTPNVIHFHKKATRYWESNWTVSTKNVDFCRKRGRKNGAAPHKWGWNSQKAVKSNNALQSLPINKNRNDHAENSTMNEIKTS